MSEIDNIVSVTISRETASVTQAGFGIPAVIAKFATTDTTVEFNRTRFYGSLDEVTADGWSSTSDVYQAFSKIFGQNPSVSTAMLGRWDAGDATLTDALGAINLDNSDWYVFSVVGQKTATLVFSADFVASNSIVVTVNGTAVTAVPFTTDQATTMAALETQIETDITDSVVTVDGTDPDTRTLLISIPDKDTFTSAVVTGGASQPTAISYSDSDAEALLAAAWAEGNKKLFFVVGSNPDVADGSESGDLFSQLLGLGYDRTAGLFKKDASQYAEAAWPGEDLPFDPGSQTWAYKAPAGISPDPLTTSEQNAVFAKNGNTYQRVAGANITRYGKVFSGEFIDIIRGVDWLEAEIQTAVYIELVNKRKIPFDDTGIQLIEGALAGALDRGVQRGVLQAGTVVITVPAYADISANDKANRNLPDVKFTALLLGAIHTVQIKGTLTL